MLCGNRDTLFTDCSLVRSVRVLPDPSRLEPMKKVARMLRSHRPLLLNWFRAKGQFSSGIVEGFNNKAKVTTRKAYGFKTYHAAEIALYHALGALPVPETAHEFF